jgi:glycosyltransferase involved in cell wall biosynthesis
LSINKDKVVFFLPSFANGGAEEVIVNIFNEISRQDKNAVFIVGNKTGNNFRKIHNKKKIYSLEKKRLIFCFFSIYKYLKKNKNSTVITTLSHSNIFFCVLKKFINFRLIIRETNIDIEVNKNFLEKKNIKLIRLLKFFFYNYSDKIIAINNYSKKEISKFIKNKKKISVLNNPIIFKKIKNKNLFINRLSPYILYCGRIEKHKNIDFLIKLFREILKNNNINLLILGDGRELEKLKKVTLGYGISKNIKFLKYKKNIGPFMKFANFYMSFSDHEGQPNAIIQASYYGTKIYMKKYPGILNIFRNNNQFRIFNKLNIKTILSTFNNDLQNSKRKKINKTISSHYNFKKNINNYKKIIYEKN